MEELQPINTTVKKNEKSDTVKNKWIDDLTKLKLAFLTGERDTVKTFFTFPVADKKNEIWYRVDSRYAASLPKGKTHPFKESDFDKHYNNLFGIDFINTLEILEITELHKKPLTQSAKLKIIPGSLSYMKAYVDKTRKIVTLEIINEGKSFGKYSFQYQFNIINDQFIKFKTVVSVYDF